MGFPSPAEDYLEPPLDLNQHLINHPAATFFFRVQGNNMAAAGISAGDLLVVDRALDARNGNVIIASLNGKLAVRRLKKTANRISLHMENSEKQAVTEFEIWGVVTHTIHNLMPESL